MIVVSPSVEYGALSPMLIVLGAAVAGVFVEALLPRHLRYVAQRTLATAGLAAALIAVLALSGHRAGAAMGSVAVDGPTLFLQAAVLITGLLALAPIARHRLDAFAPAAALTPASAAERSATSLGIQQTEVFPLVMFTVSGMLLLPAAADLLTMFVSLEVLSLPLYVLCGLTRRRRVLAQESSLKYFLLGAFSSAFFLYGTALLYGCSGTFDLTGIAAAISAGHADPALASAGTALVAVGVLFKVGAVPFHAWVPDVYQGAPTPITGLMAAGTKLAGFGALLRLFYVALPGLMDQWRPLLGAVAVLTMVFGSVVMVSQTDVKRMLAYSSISTVGFVLLGVTAPNTGVAPTMFYVLVYGVSTVGAFTVIGLIRGGDGLEDNDIEHWAGFGRRSPLPAAALALFLLAAAGVPLTSGFVAKFGVFSASLAAGNGVLVLVAVACSAIAAYAYARVILTIFFAPAGGQTPELARATPATVVGVWVAAAATVLIGVAPQPLLSLASNAADFLH
ncbi:NADH dehydrogenase subunit N [Mycolicibacterium cosmeticum]|uniref:NADH-quinone oxidoreductase subunit N n=1 Tax=Mycolicibacterium cosmeticum TaxID=258533 RepID=W9ASF9_MYCCO|nr:NADH dehydrogenase subunit N [Mycolicibacterium cosmeticum]